MLRVGTHLPRKLCFLHSPQKAHPRVNDKPLGFSFSKVTLDPTFRNALSDDDREFRDACGVLAMMTRQDRPDAGVFLCGLLGHYASDLTRKGRIVDALGQVQSEQAAYLLFRELENIESSNSTRSYIDRILEALARFPIDTVEDWLLSQLSNRKWTHRMKGKLRDTLEEAAARSRGW